MKDVIKVNGERYWIRTPGMGDYQKLKVTQRIYDGADSYHWTEVFAFWPVKTISGKYVWLRKIYKRKYWAVWGKSGFHMEPETEYGDLFDVILNPCVNEY